MKGVGMFGLGYQELMIILVIVLLLFGAQKLPELARGLGKSVSEFKRGQSEDDALKAEKTTEDKKSA
jgi:sec-independent protein translocase protein TatA